MANPVSLNDLIEALAGAVIDAQDRIEQHQLSNLSNYFDEQNRPKSVLIRLPSQHPNAAEGDEDLYRAPLLPLVPSNMLKIKDVEISFDVDLGAIADELGPSAASEPAPKGSSWAEEMANLSKRVSVHTRAGVMGRRGGLLHVVMRVEGSEPSDGVSRLLNHLAQTQGVIKTTNEG